MTDTLDKDATASDAIENQMRTVGICARGRIEFQPFAGSLRVFREESEAVLQPILIEFSLMDTKAFYAIEKDRNQVFDSSVAKIVSVTHRRGDGPRRELVRS